MDHVHIPGLSGSLSPVALGFEFFDDLEQAAYIGVEPAGPFKPEHYRY